MKWVEWSQCIIRASEDLFRFVLCFKRIILSLSVIHNITFFVFGFEVFDRAIGNFGLVACEAFKWEIVKRIKF